MGAIKWSNRRAAKGSASPIKVDVVEHDDSVDDGSGPGSVTLSTILFMVLISTAFVAVMYVVFGVLCDSVQELSRTIVFSR